jgi:hypothetical protein
LRVERIDAAFGRQFLWCEAVSDELAESNADPDPDAVAEAVAKARSFGAAAVARIAEARADLERFAAAGPVALWGAGSKGMTYLNLMSDSTSDGTTPIAGVVDINPRKAGWGVPGTSQVISGPEAMVDMQPRTVLIANPVYADEISATLSGMGVDADVLPLWKD